MKPSLKLFYKFLQQGGKAITSDKTPTRKLDISLYCPPNEECQWCYLNAERGSAENADSLMTCMRLEMKEFLIRNYPAIVFCLNPS